MNRPGVVRCVAACGAALWLLAPGSAAAQTKTGTMIGEFALIEPSARITGMGNAGVSLYDGLEAAFYNPAAIGQLSAPSVEFTYSSWLAGISYSYVAGALPMGNWGNLFASVTGLNSGTMDVRTVTQPLGTGERFDVGDIGLGLGYGRQISQRFSAGIQLSYLQETIWHTSTSAFTVNVGTLFRLAPDGLHIGASISNFGTNAAFDGRDLRIVYDNDPSRYGDNSQLPGARVTDAFAVPTLFRVGVGIPLKLDDDSALQLAIDTFHPSDNSESMSLGAEWSFQKTLALRAGYQNLFQQDAEEGLTLGVGVHGAVSSYHYGVDYAWADEGRLGNTQRITLNASF